MGEEVEKGRCLLNVNPFSVNLSEIWPSPCLWPGHRGSEGLCYAEWSTVAMGQRVQVQMQSGAGQYTDLGGEGNWDQQEAPEILGLGPQAFPGT